MTGSAWLKWDGMGGMDRGVGSGTQPKIVEFDVWFRRSSLLCTSRLLGIESTTTYTRTVIKPRPRNVRYFTPAFLTLFQSRLEAKPVSSGSTSSPTVVDC